MAKNNKKHDFRDLKNLIKELDERQDKAIDEIRKHNAKAMALKLLIAGMTIQGWARVAPTQQQVSNVEDGGILWLGLGYSGTSYYTKLEFTRFDG